LAELSGSWTAQEASKVAAFTLQVNAATLVASITNPADRTSCWKIGNGTVATTGNTITITATNPDKKNTCTKHVVGTVKRTNVGTVQVGDEYLYTQEGLELHWHVR
jgi:hypothetical protein